MKRPTVEEHLARVEHVRTLIAKGMTFGQVKAELRLKYGDDFHPRAAGRLYAKAKQSLASSMAELDRQALTGALVEHLQSILSSPQSRALERVRAIECMADILGLAAPSRQEVSVAVAPQKKPIAIDWEALRSMQRELYTQQRPPLPPGAQE